MVSRMYYGREKNRFHFQRPQMMFLKKYGCLCTLHELIRDIVLVCSGVEGLGILSCSSHLVTSTCKEQNSVALTHFVKCNYIILACNEGPIAKECVKEGAAAR